MLLHTFQSKTKIETSHAWHVLCGPWTWAKSSGSLASAIEAKRGSHVHVDDAVVHAEVAELAQESKRIVVVVVAERGAGHHAAGGVASAAAAASVGGCHSPPPRWCYGHCGERARPHGGAPTRAPRGPPGDQHCSTGCRGRPCSSRQSASWGCDGMTCFPTLVRQIDC
jgi:hypothetical protein